MNGNTRKEQRFCQLLSTVLVAFSFLFLGVGSILAANLPNLTVIGVSPGGFGPPVESQVPAYRWLVEEDKTYHVQTIGGVADPTTFDPTWDQYNDTMPGGETLSVSFHRSYMPVVGKGCAGFGDLDEVDPDTMDIIPFCNEVTPVLKPDTHYYVSVVPRSGASIGGASFVTDGFGNIPPTTAYVNQYPIKTAQVSVIVFHDNAPINNAQDLPTEIPGTGPEQTDMSGFTITVEDAGGRYGASAGAQSQDAFGNPLGTTYDAVGNSTGFSPLVTGPDGKMIIKNLAPGKYGIQVVPPAGAGWQQTSTIEGTKVIDAWVKADEPPFFAEVGPAGFHVAAGFIKPMTTWTAGGTTVTGTVVNNHLSRPPVAGFYNGSCFSHTTPWVGLNDMSGGGTGVYAAATDENCSFSIANVPDGNYQLVVWDSYLDLIFAFKGFSVQNGQCNTPTGCDFGEVPVFQWFHRSEHRAFTDTNANGVWETGEGPAALETGFSLRWRDGTVYQGDVSDGVGAFTFDQIFPFFSWLVAEVDFVRHQATGVTVVVDDGGAIPASVSGPAPLDDNDITFGRAINPQNQLNPGDTFCGPGGALCDESNTDYRIEKGPVLTQGFQGFAGQTNAFLWGKRPYPFGENGGISGIVFYAVTRAENDPAYAAAEPWEPGIPGVTVNLYASDGVDPVTGVATKGVLLNTTVTDSWDESLPTGCKYGNDAVGPFSWSPDGATFYETDCYDGLRNFNQARPAVFDGGYAFDAICELGLNSDGVCVDGLVGPIPPQDYIVEVVAPPGYEILKPEDKNVDFGDVYEPVTELLPPPCVGDLHTVPALLTLFPDEPVGAPFAGDQRPLCDSKLVTVSGGFNAAADFWLFTEVPIAAHAIGLSLDDTTNEINPNSPNYGEKYAPPFIPVIIRDWTGREIGRTLTDQFGRYNFLAPSTITTNLPAPSGMSPNMLITCMNDPGDDPANPDPNWNQQYNTFCYTFQYMPGTTVYLDTPVIPVAAFAGADQFPLDCEYPDGTPRISHVTVPTNNIGGGPYIPRAVDGTPDVVHTLEIYSLGEISVPNPNYCNPSAGVCPAGADTDPANRTIVRDYSFGDAAGTIMLGDVALDQCAWGPSGDLVSCTIPDNTVLGDVGGRQLTVIRANGQETVAGITVQFGLRGNTPIVPVSPGESIQAAINSAGANALILVAPGNYNEMVVMWKPVQLQGWGEGSTTINALKSPTEKLLDWQALVESLIASDSVDLLPGQDLGQGTAEPTPLWSEEGAGILVLGNAFPLLSFAADLNRHARVDGFTIRSADNGGGIVANGYNGYLQISNNRIANNSGFYNGGIRSGHPFLVTPDGLAYTDSSNDYLNIHHNQVVFNGGLGGIGGGISMCTGSDSYRITENWVCGNFTIGSGGGIGHVGYSDGSWVGDPNNKVFVDAPLIADNTVIFNESFFQGETVSAGGIYIGGAASLAGEGLTPGSGSVQIISNLVQGNSAGAGDGGGIRLAGVNGQDVANNPNNVTPVEDIDPPMWNTVDLFNNMIVNNVAGLAGGGISLQDAVDVRIVHNTIANNDSLAVAGEAFGPASPSESTPQPGAGVVSHLHSPQLAGTGGVVGTFSDPRAFADNIVYHNRQFYFLVQDGVWGLCPNIGGAVAGLLCPGEVPVYHEIGVVGGGDLTAHPSNLVGINPPFVSEYTNGNRSAIVQDDVAIGVPAAFDEGGNFIRPQFGPLSLYNDAVMNDGLTGLLYGDYHLATGAASAAIDTGSNFTGSYSALLLDFDGDPRPFGANVDIGADEAQSQLAIIPEGAPTGDIFSEGRGYEYRQTTRNTGAGNSAVSRQRRMQTIRNSDADDATVSRQRRVITGGGESTVPRRSGR